jgi:hypothetical protein
MRGMSLEPSPFLSKKFQKGGREKRKKGTMLGNLLSDFFLQPSVMIGVLSIVLMFRFKRVFLPFICVYAVLVALPSAIWEKYFSKNVRTVITLKF